MTMRVEYPVLDDKKPLLQDNRTPEPGSSNSRWRWRPGMKPRNALNIGVLFSVVALLFIVIGLVSLIVGIVDSNSPPVQVPGVVVGYSTNFLDSLPHLTIRVEKAGATATISPAVSQETAHALHTGDRVILDYSQRLHFLYALESGGQRYMLPGTSAAGNPLGSVALVILGLIILPYPGFLAFWGWRDLHSQGIYTLTARVIALRSSKETRAAQPGLTPRILRSWYRMALEPVDSSSLQEVITFNINEERYRSLREGIAVQITYSPHLHYIYALKQVDEGNIK